jgi:hypothetical protein
VTNRIPTMNAPASSTAISDVAEVDPSIDPRLAFLARAHARFILVEAGEMSLDEALDGLIEPICDCQRWPLAAQWERTHPPSAPPPRPEGRGFWRGARR